MIYKSLIYATLTISVPLVADALVLRNHTTLFEKVVSVTNKPRTKTALLAVFHPATANGLYPDGVDSPSCVPVTAKFPFAVISYA